MYGLSKTIGAAFVIWSLLSQLVLADETHIKRAAGL